MRQPKFEVKQDKNGSWYFNIPKSLSDTGKKQKRSFRSRRLAELAAKDFREQYKKYGQGFSVLPPRVADDALQAWHILDPLGITLTEAARQAAARIATISASVKVNVAVVAWEADIDTRLRSTTTDSYKLTMKFLNAAHSDDILAEIKPEQFARVITGKSYVMHRNNLRVFLNWCASPPRRWCDAKVIQDVPNIKRRKNDNICVMSPEEALHLLRTAEKHYPETVPIYAIGFFGGVRTEERKRLESAHFNEDGIEMDDSVTKKNKRRFIPMNDALKAWLERYPFKPCVNFKDKDTALRRLAGYDVSSRKLKNPPEPTLGRFPKNVIRHTHASVEIANGATLEDLLFRFGHTESPETLRSDYVGRYTKRAAKAFIEIRPIESC